MYKIHIYCSFFLFANLRTEVVLKADDFLRLLLILEITVTRSGTIHVHLIL